MAQNSNCPLQIILTIDLLRQLWPNGNARIGGLLESIASCADDVFAKYGADDPIVVAHAMAQFSEECGAGTEVVENLNYSAQGLMRVWPSRFDPTRAAQLERQPQAIANAVYNGRMGNRLGTDDGWNYRGRGASQTTGRENYQRLGDLIGLDLINNPDLVNDPANFLECGVADFASICGCVPSAKQDDIIGVTRRLNGGLIGLPDRGAWLSRWKDALSI